MDKKKVISWALYDWGNSAFATTVMAAFFPMLLKDYLSNPENYNESTFYLGISNSVASLFVAAMAPFLGAISDTGSTKKKFLFTFAFLGALSTSLLWIVEQGNWQIAALLYVIGCIGFSGGNTFYDALLPSVAKKDKFDFVSSLGFSLGYAGGGALFVINILMYQYPQSFGISDPETAARLSLICVGAWWAVFTIPVLLFVPEEKNKNDISLGNAVQLGWIQIKTTFKEIKKMKIIGVFLISYFLYMDGVDTIIRMAFNIGDNLGFPTEDLLIVLLIVQFIGVPAALLFSWLSSIITPRNAVLFAIMVYTLITGFSYFIETKTHIFIFAFFLGCFQGGIQAISRSLFARLVPKGKEGEFFGFYNMLGKFSAVIGPTLLGYITLLTGNVRIGLLSIVILFIGGGLIFYRVDFEEGERIAKEFSN